MARLSSALLAALAAGAAGQTFVGPEYIPKNAHPMPLWLDPPKEAAVASCAIDVGISLVFLGHAGTAINAAVLSCKDNDEQKGKALCAASTAGIVDGLLYAIGFLSSAAAACQGSFEVKDEAAIARAACAADTSNFLASLALLAQAGAGINAACAAEVRRLPPGDLRNLGRRLGSELNITAVEQLRSLQLREGEPASIYQAPSEKLLRDRSAEIASCVFDVGQATLFFARAALMINSAVSDCSRFELRTGGERSHARCAVDVSSVVGAFSFVASGVSFAAFHCPYHSTTAPACSGAISNVVAALSQLSAAGAGFMNSCGHKPELHV